jgi:hypothetical protein
MQTYASILNFVINNLHKKQSDSAMNKQIIKGKKCWTIHGGYILWNKLQTYFLSLNYRPWKAIQKKTIFTFWFVQIVLNQFHNEVVTHQLKII